jgi:hypothetical protein
MPAADRTLHLAPGAGSLEGPDAGVAWFSEQCMTNGAPLERYVAHAERIGDQELATFFRRALAESNRASPTNRTRNSDRRRRTRRVGPERRRG